MTPTARRDEQLYWFATVSFLLFALRDGFTGSIRYVFTLTKLDALWFVPDLMAFALCAFFALDQFQKRNALGVYLVLIFLASIVVSMFYMNDTAAGLFSSIKMFVPVFAGLAFFGRSITETRFARNVLLAASLASAAGLIASPYVDFPWQGQTIDAFGIERSATKLWWVGSAIRYGGFAGDSTMAAFMVIFPYFLIHRHFRLVTNIALWLICLWAVQVSTSKTALLLLFLFPLVSLLLSGGDEASKLDRAQRWARLSFLCVLIPPLAVVLIGGVDLTSISASLYSLADRINNSWQLPFVYLSEVFPVGLFIGCGLGCFSYPMNYTGMAAYEVPVDNFYLSTYLMMGYPFIIFVASLALGVRNTTNVGKLMILILFNVYSVTIQCYGPSFATLMFGYGISGIFAARPGSLGALISPRAAGAAHPRATVLPTSA